MSLQQIKGDSFLLDACTSVGQENSKFRKWFEAWQPKIENGEDFLKCIEIELNNLGQLKQHLQDEYNKMKRTLNGDSEPIPE